MSARDKQKDSQRRVYDIVTLGSATLDVFAKTRADTITVRHHKQDSKMLAYPLGAKILIEELDFQLGGGGTNTATSFAQQGLRVGYIGKLGDDEAGRRVQTFLKKKRIDFLGAVGEQTGYSVILDSEESDRTILTFKGANNTLHYDEIQATVANLETSWLYCGSMLEESYETMLRVMADVKKKGGSVAFNPSSYQAERGIGTLQKALDHVDVLILNHEEAELLVGKQTEETKELLRILGAAGPGVVVITDGAAGSTLYDHRRMLHISAKEGLKIMETTGAGDAFGAGLITGLARGYNYAEALLLGTLNAESAIGVCGAQKGLLTQKKAEQLLAHKEEQARVQRINI